MITELFRFDGDGWFPRVSNDAGKVCFGNGLSRVYEVTTGKLWSAFPARQSRWLTDSIVTCTVEIDTLHAKRLERDGVVIAEQDDKPELVAGNDFDADQGHWLSCFAAGRLVLDGRVIDGHFRNAQMRWPWVVATQDDREIVWFLNGILCARAPLPARANELRLQGDGSVTTGYFWDAREIEPHVPVLDVTVTPWRREKPHVMCNEVRWTSTETPDGRLGVLGVYAPDQAIIIDGWGCAWLDVKYDGSRDRFIVAGCDSNGQLRIYSIDVETPRQSISKWGTVQETKPTIDALPKFTEPKYAGYYFTSGRYGRFHPKENCTVVSIEHFTNNGKAPADVVQQVQAVAQETDRLVCSNDRATLEALRPYWSKVAAVMLGELQTPGEVEFGRRSTRALLSTLKLPYRPVMSTLMVHQSLDWDYDNTADIAGCEIYFDEPASTYAEMRRMVHDRISSVLEQHSSKVMLIVQSYDRSNPRWKAVPAMIEMIQLACAEAMAREERIIGSLWFAYGRTTGVVDHLEWEAWQRAVVERVKVPAIIKDIEDTNVNEQEVRNVVGNEIASNKIPRDIAQGAMQRFRNEVIHDRDKVGTDNISGGAQYIYFWPAFYSVVGANLAKFGPPRDSDPAKVNAKWSEWATEGLIAAANFYWSEQGKPGVVNPQ